MRVWAKVPPGEGEKSPSGIYDRAQKITIAAASIATYPSVSLAYTRGTDIYS